MHYQMDDRTHILVVGDELAGKSSVGSLVINQLKRVPRVAERMINLLQVVF
jgi:hypothetical protein